MRLDEVMALRDQQWAEATTAQARAIIREEYREAGWRMCQHGACPPFDCRAE